MRSFKTFSIVSLSALTLAACGGPSGGGAGGARDNAWAVGSSTVYHFAAAVAEETGKTGVKAPKVEQNGTGAGIKMFCAGVGSQHPDIANASRRMKKSEYEDCAKSGVKDIIEIQVGLDGIAFAEAKGGPDIKLTPVDVYKALAAKPFGKEQTAKNWSDVNPALPAIPILVYGPPSTSGTRDALAELILTQGCETDPAMKALKDSNKNEHKKICTGVREDGAFVDSGEQDNLIVQKISENPKAIGVFGFSYLEENMGVLKGIPMSGVTPTYATISDFSYPGARPLYIYVKQAHLNAVKGLKEFVAQWPKMWSADGALKKKGMVISPDDVRKKNEEIVASMTLMDPSGLK
jgi:phosphate transport system substrate-binding protein